MASINLIEYGNPTREQFEILANEPQFVEIENEFYLYPPAENSSSFTRTEIEAVIEATKELFPESEKFPLYAEYDADLELSLRKVLAESGLNPNDIKKCMYLVREVRKKTDGVMLRTKYKFQRPRPFQLARALKMPLFPYDTTSSHTPSYPSGHSFQAYIWASCIGSHYPAILDKLTEFANDVSQSRISLGVHYPSDIDAGYYLCQLFLDNQEFQDMFLKEDFFKKAIASRTKEAVNPNPES